MEIYNFIFKAWKVSLTLYLEIIMMIYSILILGNVSVKSSGAHPPGNSRAFAH